MNRLPEAKQKSMFRLRISTLLWLVLFVFVIVLISFVFARLIVYIIMWMGMLTHYNVDIAFGAFLLLLMVSLVIGTALATLSGNYFLRPLHRLTVATKEIANGNFNVHVDAKGSIELVRLAASFNEMAKELSSIETLRSDFVSNISHEFKTPTASIRGFAKRLLKNNLSDEQRIEYLQIIVSESERLSRLSSNVLLLSNLESYSSDAEQMEYPLDEQIRKIILLLTPQLQKQNLETEIQLESVQIKANEELLYHVWLNLLGNAIKFSPMGETVEITLESKEGKAIVSISDNGAGMDDNVKKHIFEKFYQADQSRTTEGNGLGLALVKKILDIEGGIISVNSEPGKGTKFTVTLPLSQTLPDS